MSEETFVKGLTKTLRLFDRKIEDLKTSVQTKLVELEKTTLQFQKDIDEVKLQLSKMNQSNLQQVDMPSLNNIEPRISSLEASFTKLSKTTESILFRTMQQPQVPATKYETDLQPPSYSEQTPQPPMPSTTPAFGASSVSAPHPSSPEYVSPVPPPVEKTKQSTQRISPASSPQTTKNKSLLDALRKIESI